MNLCVKRLPALSADAVISMYSSPNTTDEAKSGNKPCMYIICMSSLL